MSFWGMTEGSSVKVGGVIAGAVGDIYSAYQTRDIASKRADERNRAAARNAELMRRDADTALKEARALRHKTERDLTIHYEKMDRMIGSQKAGFANAGVVVSAGSAAAVQAVTADQGELNAKIILHDGMTDVNRMRDAADRYNKMAQMTLEEAAWAGYYIESGAATEIGNIFAAGTAKAGKSVYDIGTTEGWWGAPTPKTTTRKYPGAGTYGTASRPSADTRWKTWH